MIALIDDERFPATTALTKFWACVFPHAIDLDEAAGNRRLPPEAYALELTHYTWTLRVWNGWRDDRFLAKRIEDMTMVEFTQRWARMGAAAFKAWRAWCIGLERGQPGNESPGHTHPHAVGGSHARPCASTAAGNVAELQIGTDGSSAPIARAPSFLVQP